MTLSLTPITLREANAFVEAHHRHHGPARGCIVLGRALADVRQRCGGYPDSRVDGDGGIVAVVVRERDEARRSIACARYCLENDHGEAAVRACLDGMGMGPGIAEEYQSDLDRVTLERDAAVAEKDRAEAAMCCAMTERDEAQAALVALREAAERWNNATCDVLAGTYAAVGSGPNGQAAAAEALAACDAITDALAATPATLAGQARARVLRDAADDGERRYGPSHRCNAWPWLRALADEAERAK